jgi:hypothetical protein
MADRRGAASGLDLNLVLSWVMPEAGRIERIGSVDSFRARFETSCSKSRRNDICLSVCAD